MKKFTYLMSLLLAFVGATATAQTYTGNAVSAAPDPANCVTSVGEISSSNYYVLYNTGRQKYVTLNPSTRLLELTSSVGTDQNSIFALFQIESVVEDAKTYHTFKLAASPAGEGYYIPALNNGKDHFASTSAEKFELSVADATNGYFKMKGKSGDLWFDANGSTFTGWLGSGSNCTYQLVPVTIGSETYSNYAVTYSIKVGEEVKESDASRAWGGDTFGSSSITDESNVLSDRLGWNSDDWASVEEE